MDFKGILKELRIGKKKQFLLFGLMLLFLTVGVQALPISKLSSYSSISLNFGESNYSAEHTDKGSALVSAVCQMLDAKGEV